MVAALPPGRLKAFGPTPHEWYFRAKRIADFVLALTLFILTSPLLLLAMLLVKLTSRGPALYLQTRVGKHGKPFLIFKVRTMTYQCEKLTGAQWSRPGDSRITPLGRWLRRTHLDELPQLWNVIRGDMAIIGPRPERPEFVPTLEKAIGLYAHRLAVLPGVTGLAQVQLPPDTDLDSVRSKLAYDLFYIQHSNLWLDFRIVAATACKMAAIPYHWLSAIFQFPARDRIEWSYQALLPASPTPPTQRIGRTTPAEPSTAPVPVTARP